jgi:mono/diheme cytochrome c family protein
VKVLAKSARCLSDEEIAGLATYIRNAWGNRAPVVSASHVAAIRNDITRKTAVK